ncbi:MAG: YkvA family protein [Burkholderiaceae bacterium]
MLIITKLLQTLKNKAKSIKLDSLILRFTCKKSQIPWVVKLFGFLILAYAFSPTDLSPDFISIIGYLDEIILLPFLLALAIKLIPLNIYLKSQIHAQDWINQK